MRYGKVWEGEPPALTLIPLAAPLACQCANRHRHGHHSHRRPPLARRRAVWAARRRAAARGAARLAALPLYPEHRLWAWLYAHGAAPQLPPARRELAAAPITITLAA